MLLALLVPAVVAWLLLEPLVQPVLQAAQLPPPLPARVSPALSVQRLLRAVRPLLPPLAVARATRLL